VAVDGKNFSEEVGGVDEAGKEDKTEEKLAGPLLEPVETHVDRLGLLRPNRRSRKTNGHSLSTSRRGGDCWGCPRLVRVSVNSTNTCPPPKAAAYSASATDATITGMRWQWAWRGALWVTEMGKVKEGLD
jgi:hypothetical protein